MSMHHADIGWGVACGEAVDQLVSLEHSGDEYWTLFMEPHYKVVEEELNTELSPQAAQRKNGRGDPPTQDKSRPLIVTLNVHSGPEYLFAKFASDNDLSCALEALSLGNTNHSPAYQVPKWIEHAFEGGSEGAPRLFRLHSLTRHQNASTAPPLKSITLQRVNPRIMNSIPPPSSNHFWFPDTHSTQTIASESSGLAGYCSGVQEWVSYSLSKFHGRVLSTRDKVLGITILNEPCIFLIVSMDSEAGLDTDLYSITPKTSITVDPGLAPLFPSYKSDFRVRLEPYYQLGSFSDIIQELGLFIPLPSPGYNPSSSSFGKTVLLHGPRCSGKSTFLQNFCHSQSRSIIWLSFAEYLEEKRSKSSAEDASISWNVYSSVLHKTFLKAILCAPSIVIFHDLDILSTGFGCIEVENGGGETAKDISYFLSLFEKSKYDTLVVGEASLPISKFPPFFAQYEMGGFGRMLEFPALCDLDRECIILSILQRRFAPLFIPATKSSASSEMAALISATMGYTLGDLYRLINRSNINSIECSDIPSTLSTILACSKSYQPSHLTYAKGFKKITDVLVWESIGGYEKIKRKLKMLTSWVRRPPTSALGIVPPRGILLYGPSGCGKTLLVNGILGICQMPFVRLRCNDLYSKYLGDTEAQVRAVFAEARAIAPAIIVLDEIDSIAYKRQFDSGGMDGASSGINERVLSTLLNEMDGIGGGGRILVIACTNAPQLLDDALMRPGRLDSHFYVPKPEDEDRLDILRNLTNIDRGRSIHLDESINLPELAEITRGFTGADLCILLREAALVRLSSHPESLPVIITWNDIQVAISGLLESIHGGMTSAPSASPQNGWWMLSREDSSLFEAYRGKK